MQPAVNHPPEAKKWLYAGAALSLAAGIVHVLAAQTYFAIWYGYVFFFLGAVTAQFSYAVFLWVYPSIWEDSPHPGLLWAGILGNGLIVGMWLITHAIGIPFFGPNAWQVQPMSGLDFLALLFELGLIVSVTMLLRVYSALRRPPKHHAGEAGDPITQA